MTKKVIWLISLVSLIFIAKGIKKPFWQNRTYQQAIIETQKEGNYLPYTVRKLLWNQTVIVKSLVERAGNILWMTNIWILGLSTLAWGIRKKKWAAVVVFCLSLGLVVIEDNPNSGYYFWFLTPSMLLAWLR